MDIIKYIEKLREKPEHVRKKYSFFVAFSFTFVIFAGWMASYGFKDSQILANNKDSIDKPISSLTASALGAFQDIKNLFFSTNKIDYSADKKIDLEVKPGNR